MIEQSPSEIPQPEPPVVSQPEVMPKGEIPYPTQSVGHKSHRHESNSGWIFGLVLVVLGGLFILQNLTGFEFHNWWALFILIPAISSFASAWNGYQVEHRFTQHVRSSVVGGFILLLITSAFLFTFSWNLLWPLILVLAGVGILINGLLKD